VTGNRLEENPMSVRSAHVTTALLISVAAAGCSRTGQEVTERGIGDVVVGMPAGALLAAPAGTDSMQCRMATWPGAPMGIRAMLEGNKVVRVDVDSGGTPTSEGARIGDAEARVMELYAGRVEPSPHKYVAGGKYLTVRPASPADSAYRIVFETDGQVIVRYRAGQRPQVEYVERCG
jgi:hypothetical protein